MSEDAAGLTVRELVAELAMGPVEDFDLPAVEVMRRRGFLSGGPNDRQERSAMT